MANNFEALIKAVLDTQSIEGQIEKIADGKYAKIKADTATLQDSIEVALNKTYHINVVADISKRDIQNTAKSINKGLEAAMTKSPVDKGHSSKLVESLLGKGFDQKVSDAISDSIFGKMGDGIKLNLQSVKTQIEQVKSEAEKIKKISFTAFDESGNKILNTTTLDKNGNVKSSVTEIVHSFNTASTAAKTYSKTVADAISTKISTGGIEAALSNVNAQFMAVSNSSSDKINDIKGNIDTLKRLGNELTDGNLTGDALINKYQEYSRVLQQVKNDIIVVKNESKTMASTMDIAALDSKMASWLQKNTKASKEFGASVEILRSELKALGEAGGATTADLQRLAAKFKEIDIAATVAGQKGKSFGSQLKSAFQGLAGIFSVAGMVDAAVDGLREMYQAVYDIDTAMTNLKKVTDETDERYESFLKDSANSAKELGRSVSSLVEQSASWSKLGYSMDEAEKLAKLSSIYANVAELSDETAVSDMVTAMKAFNIETSDAIRIVDSLNELGNRFAVSAGDLGQGLTRSASAMNAAGTDMYKTLAMITGGSEITQNANEFGSFLKVASMRLRGMKGELESLGEEVDSNVDSISKVQTQILNLTRGKINIFDENKEFRDYYVIMEEIAEVYDTLTSTDQAKLSEILFGKMRGNQGQALIQAFKSGQIQKAYEAATESSGSAYKEQERWMESLEAKTQEFNAAWQELSMTFLKSDFLKGLIDVGTAILEILTDIIDNIGVIDTLAVSGGIFAFFKNLG